MHGRSHVPVDAGDGFLSPAEIPLSHYTGAAIALFTCSSKEEQYNFIPYPKLPAIFSPSPFTSKMSVACLYPKNRNWLKNFLLHKTDQIMQITSFLLLKGIPVTLCPSDITRIARQLNCKVEMPKMMEIL